MTNQEMASSEAPDEGLEPNRPAESASATATPDREFVDQFVKTQRRLYLYLLAQVGNPHPAEEILQNVNVVILSKWQQFEPGTNFLAWAYRIASLEVLKYRQKSKRQKLLFDDDYLATIARTVEELHENTEMRQKALARCLKKLKPVDRELVRLKYQLGRDGQALSEMLNRPVNSVYQSLGRIRRSLLKCVEAQIAAAVR
ncbi:sigma-70 family RNA polymerase sigma factor [Rubinisphaera margarita]|uniref:sigma-70 family RNA polymerase sigma factor n=1 Tax=Rubinisphaera margarita TaxID=2909586 RepID=UPI001EE915E0|nr:sigma-70 family RNA polymerase sigma factor [Rubinisphaera margarita]MCG6154345.1 sigma-70 family RNA polymerase sigma factor [Rubinisphaera margarita]